MPESEAPSVPARYALIVGSGFPVESRDNGGLTVDTRFGEPSAPIHEVLFHGCTVLSLARHGDAHTIPPHAINYRANLSALQQSGADRVVALNTVGVISKLRQPGEIAIPGQIIDYTWGRAHTIFDGADGVVEHIDFSEPFSAELRLQLLAAARAGNVDCHDGGTYAATQGPRLETAAEVDRLERDGADFVGMTAMPEASIARELGLQYACLALVVNRAAGRGDRPIHDDVEACTQAASSNAMRVLQHFFQRL